LSPSTKPTFLVHLREALINVGFFYLQNPPISVDAQHVFLAKALELFDLPLEKKLEIEMVNSPHFLGYSKLGAEITALKPDYREQFDVGLFRPLIGRSHSSQVSLQPNFLHPKKTSRCTEISTVLIRYVLCSRRLFAVFVAYILD